MNDGYFFKADKCKVLELSIGSAFLFIISVAYVVSRVRSAVDRVIYLKKSFNFNGIW